MPNDCIFAEFILIVSQIQRPPRKKQLIAPFVERHKTATLEKPSVSTWNNLLKHFNSVEFLL